MVIRPAVSGTRFVVRSFGLLVSWFVDLSVCLSVCLSVYSLSFCRSLCLPILRLGAVSPSIRTRQRALPPVAARRRRHRRWAVG